MAAGHVDDVRAREPTGRDGTSAAGEHPVPGDDRQQPERRQRPGGADERAGVARRQPAHVAQRVGNRAVAVDAEHEQVENRRRAGRVVDRQPELADGDAERPVDGEDVDGADGHYDDADGQVGRRQAHDEHVAHLQLSIIYTLRNRNHSKILIPKTSDLNERHFLIRVLCKHCY